MLEQAAAPLPAEPASCSLQWQVRVCWERSARTREEDVAQHSGGRLRVHVQRDGLVGQGHVHSRL